MSFTQLDRARLAELLDLARDPRNYSPIAVPKSVFLKLVSYVDSVRFRVLIALATGFLLGALAVLVFFSTEGSP